MDGDRDRDRAAAAVLPARTVRPAPLPLTVPPRRATRGGRPDPYLLAAAFFVLYTALSVTRYRRMLTMSWDLGIFEQAVRGYAHLHAPVADLKGPGFNVLGDHFSPVTALIAPFYRVFPGPVTLLVAQAVLFAVSVIPVTRAAAGSLGRARGLAIGVAYGLSWGVQRAVDFDFHEIAFAMPLLAFSLEAVLRRRWTAALWWAAPLVLVKEDLGASVACVGAVVWLRARGDERVPERTGAYAAGLAAFGVAASAWEIRWIIPAFHGPGYDALGHINGDGSLTGHIPADTAIRTLLWVLLPTSGLLALRSPLLLVALPTIGWRFVSHYPENWGTLWHYSAVLMPVAFLAGVDAAARSRTARRRWLRAYASGLPAALAGAALALTVSLPLASLSHAGTYRVDAGTRAAERLLDRIPDGATVEANVGPISRLARRTTVYWVGGAQDVNPDYLALENRSGWLRDPVGYARQLHPGADFALLGNSGGYVVLRRE
ncbi:DUF2079 domain-containing protein [Actinacidiphila alni]|uniref:DUF2079 domain-containing protein n=1 Tax=Actinacidiphila alni TaxID=380248 RepID=UPI003456B1DA